MVITFPPYFYFCYVRRKNLDTLQCTTFLTKEIIAKSEIDTDIQCYPLQIYDAFSANELRDLVALTFDTCIVTFKSRHDWRVT